MKMLCRNKKCLYEWDYNGNSKFYASCPRCRHQVSVRTAKSLNKVKKK